LGDDDLLAWVDRAVAQEPSEEPQLIVGQRQTLSLFHARDAQLVARPALGELTSSGEPPRLAFTGWPPQQPVPVRDAKVDGPREQ
jgi:hypothetical protein